jgi:uncharacterized iron-regulated membrane protein
MNPLFWRKWHRWIAFPATLFLLFASITGIIVAWTEFFGEAETLREATRDLISPVTAGASFAAWTQRVEQALRVVATEAGNVPVDQVTIQMKGTEPTITVYTGKPTGGEDRRFVVDALSGKLRLTSTYADKPFIHRLHSGEAFGDGGLVMAMFWGLALAVLTASGLIIYLTMWRPNQTGLRRVFW